MSKLLLINDLAGYGKVALSAMIPILSHMQYEVCSLPTALVSNTLDYGKFEILETTSYMKNTLQVWDELGFQFDAVSTGFIVSRPQTELVRDFCRAQKVKGTRIFTDPIMGDEGKLYNGVGEETVALMRELIATADYIVPNYTEAAYLAGPTSAAAPRGRNCTPWPTSYMPWVRGRCSLPVRGCWWTAAGSRLPASSATTRQQTSTLFCPTRNFPCDSPAPAISSRRCSWGTFCAVTR